MCELCSIFVCFPLLNSYQKQQPRLKQIAYTYTPYQKAEGGI